MALTVFSIKRGDLLPVLAATLKRPATAAELLLDPTSKDRPVDLSAGSVKFLMRQSAGDVAVISAAASIVSPADGTVQYNWVSGDTDTAGRFQGEFELTVAGKKYTFPNDRYLSVVITDDIG